MVQVKERHSLCILPSDWSWLVLQSVREGTSCSGIILKLIAAERTRIAQREAKRARQGGAHG